LIDLGFVVLIHDEIIAEFGGLGGFAGSGLAGVEAALERVANHAHYAGLEDVFGVAALYTEAIARGHVFNDANKRTGLTCAITYLRQQGWLIRKDDVLEDATVMLAEGTWSREDFAWLLWRLATPLEPSA